MTNPSHRWRCLCSKGIDKLWQSSLVQTIGWVRLDSFNEYPFIKGSVRLQRCWTYPKYIVAYHCHRILFSCPEQLNRWPCHWLTDWLKAIPETCDLWNIWSEWWGDMTWIFFYNFYNFWQFWRFFIIFEMFDNFDNFDNFWQFLTIFEIFRNFDNFWQF